MRLVTRIAATFALAFALTAPALAEITDAQRQVLADRIASFDAAMRANNLTSIMTAVPPKVLDSIATQYKVTNEQLLQAMQQQFDEAMKTVTLVSFGMDLEAAEFVTLPDGTEYALIPTETVMDLGAAAGGKMRASSTTLGLLDGETWYLVRVEDPQQVAILKQVYPGFADVTFPTGSMEPVTE